MLSEDGIFRNSVGSVGGHGLDQNFPLPIFLISAMPGMCALAMMLLIKAG